MNELADAVLPLIRTRSDLHRWSAANAHGAQMHDAVDILEAAVGSADPREVYTVTTKAIASSLAIIARADDSSGIIGEVCRRLLALHPQAALEALVPPSRLVDWMMKFQFDGVVDFFEIDPRAYAPALGVKGVAAYRARLAEVEAGLGPRPSNDRWESGHAHEWFTLEWNAQRLAVLDRDVEAIIRTHARDRSSAYALRETAMALTEIGEIDLAIDWARNAVEFDHGHQAQEAAEDWCRLVAEHRPTELLEARLFVFRRWPNATTAARLHDDAGAAWPQYREEVMASLATSPRDAVAFARTTLRDVRLAWELAHSLGLQGEQEWSDLAAEYEKVDPLAVLPVLERLVASGLTRADAHQYRVAARRLAKMRRLAAGTEKAAHVHELIAHVRETHRRRPRLQQEFDRAGLR